MKAQGLTLFKIVKVNGGTNVDKKGVKYKFQRYEMRRDWMDPQLSDHLKKKFIRQWIGASWRGIRGLSARWHIVSIHRIYQYPGFRVTFNTGFVVIFTEIREVTAGKK